MTDPAARIEARLAELWRTSRPIILERMAVLQEAAAALSRCPADIDARSRGREAAHKLSGVLGVFGLPQGSTLAGELDELLTGSDPLTPTDLVFLVTRVSDLDSIIASKPTA